MEETFERLVFDVDAAVTEFTEKVPLVIELLEELEIREIFYQSLAKYQMQYSRQCLRKSSPCTVRLQ